MQKTGQSADQVTRSPWIPFNIKMGNFEGSLLSCGNIARKSCQANFIRIRFEISDRDNLIVATGGTHRIGLLVSKRTANNNLKQTN
jgi:hypothetical protein